MIDFTVFFICSGLFFSGFTISFAIISLFIQHIVFLNPQYEPPEKFQYYYNNNFIDYTEVTDTSNNDYINGMYEEETPIGKVIMTYDENDNIFNYYCNRYISNKMLEVVCRGYVLKYDCYHIIVDYIEEGEKRHSVLNKFIKEEEKKKEETKNDIQNDVFATMKPYNTKKNENSNTNNDILIKVNYNKFKNCGRIENYIINNDISNKPDKQCDVHEQISFKQFKNKSHTE